jgi:type IV pilus assembly protein PilN
MRLIIKRKRRVKNSQPLTGSRPAPAGSRQNYMHVELNLATQPFGQRRLFWVATLSGFMVLTAVAAMLVFRYLHKNESSPEAIRHELSLRNALAQLANSETEARRTLQDPANAPVLERSLFLNELLYRKGISWTKTFADLEKILPPRVLMMSIRPELTDDKKVRLEMQVGAESPSDFIEFLKALESSELFGPATPGGYSPPTENQPLFRYQLTVNYEQRL